MNEYKNIGYIILKAINLLASEDRCIAISKEFSENMTSIKNKDFLIGWILHPFNDLVALTITDEYYFVKDNANIGLLLELIEPNINSHLAQILSEKIQNKKIIQFVDILPSSVIILEESYMRSNLWFENKLQD